MMLQNGKIMKKRTEGKAVPLLLFAGRLGRHGNQLMWSAWEYLEDLTGQQDEVETVEQKRIRLQVFPLSVFPCNGEDVVENGSYD